jgi:hypothetical protein
MKNELVADAIALLHQHGLVPEIEHGRHVKLKFINKYGSACCLTVSQSPRGTFAAKQSLGELRRLMRRAPK